MAVGSERGTTHLDSLYVDQLLVGGTIVGSVLNAGTENVTKSVETSEYIAGTVTGSEGLFTNAGVKGTLTGSEGVFGDSVITTLGVIGTATGTYANFTNVNAKGTIVGSETLSTNLGVKGTTTGSFLKGTFTGDFIGSTVKTNDMLFYTSGAIAVTTTPATCTHGLGAIPTVVLCTPNVVSATGHVKVDGANIGSAWFTMTANENGTATAYAWM